MTGCGQAGSCCPLPTELRRTSYPVRYFDHKLSSVPPRNCRPISLRLSTKSLRQAFKSNSNFRRRASKIEPEIAMELIITNILLVTI